MTMSQKNATINTIDMFTFDIARIIMRIFKCLNMRVIYLKRY